jgi:hypothetical protein
MKLLYKLLFYKIYKLVSIMREEDEASIVSGLTIGFLFALWIISLGNIFNLRKYLTNIWIPPVFLLSIACNLIVIMRRSYYKKIIVEMKTMKLPFHYHFIVFFLLSWTIIGFVLDILIN